MSTKNQKLFLKDLERQKMPTVGKKVECTITHFISINKFFVQPASENVVKILEALDKKSTVDASNSFHQLKLSPEPEQLVIYKAGSQNEQIGGVCRAIVCSYDHEMNVCKLRLIDFGNEIEQNVELTEIFLISPKLTFAPTVYQASLYGIVTVGDDEDPYIKEYFDECVTDCSVFTAIVRAVSSGSGILSLDIFEQRFPDENLSVSLNSVLVEQNYCVVIESVHSNKDTGSKNQSQCTESSTQAANVSSSIQMPDFSNSLLNQMNYEKSAAEALTGLKGADMVCDFFEKFGHCKYGNSCRFIHDLGEKTHLPVSVDFQDTDEKLALVLSQTQPFEVEMVHFLNPTSFYLRVVDDELQTAENEALSNFENVYNKLYNTEAFTFTYMGDPCYPAITQLVAAYDTTLMRWIRARVLHFDDRTDDALLLSVDFGHELKCPFERLRKLNKPFLFHPYIIWARLPIRNIDKLTQWSQQSIEAMKSVVESGEKLFCSIASSLSDAEFVMELIVTKTRNGCTVNVKDFLVEKGLALNLEIPQLDSLRVVPG